MMAGKKKEGIGGLKDTTGGLRRDDRNLTAKNVFETISIDAKNAITVLYMLQSPEENVVLRAISSLEGYGQRDKENLRLLTSFGICQYLLPLVHNKNAVVKRFAQKLIGMLCSLEEFRDQIFAVENTLNTFVDILEKETDTVMHEFAALTLAELSKECEAASNLLGIGNCIPTLFKRITSPDPDVQKNSLDVMNHLLNDVFGVETFIDSPGFDMLKILNMTSSIYPVIQLLAIEILNQLISWRRDTRPLFAFRDASGVETALDIMEKEEWEDLHAGALDLLIQVADSPELCDYILHSGCLQRMINLLDVDEADGQIEKFLAVFTRMCQTPKGRMALHKVEMTRKFCSNLKSTNDSILQSSCLGIAFMAQYGPCLDTILEENPIPALIEILVDSGNNLNLRNLAAYALSVLATEDKRGAEEILKFEKFEKLSQILADHQIFPVEFCKNIIQIYTGISGFDYLRLQVINEDIMDALMNCIPTNDDSSAKDSSLQVDALECLAGYLIDEKARGIFNSLDGACKMISCTKNKYASVREWAGQLILLASQSKEFVKSFLKNDGLNWLIKQKSTRYSMPSWESAIEAIFSAFLPAKFAFTGRLDFQDITEEGFYIFTMPCVKFLLLEEYTENKISPICPIYVANFEVSSTTSDSESIEAISVASINSEPKSHRPTRNKSVERQSPSKYTKESDMNSGDIHRWTGSLNTYSSVDYEEIGSVKTSGSENFNQSYPDPYLSEYLENLKKRIAAEETDFGDVNWFCIHPRLVSERARMIAELVADEMAGFEPDPLSVIHHKQKYINEMKYQLGTTIFPLGYIRVGDYLERAMLFKVLSDRIGFPCALVRGPHGRAWIEITVPVLNIDDPLEKVSATVTSTQSKAKSEDKLSPYSSSISNLTSAKTSLDYAFSSLSIRDDNFWFPKIQMECFKALPNYFLKPNAIVDLIKTPGRILKLNTLEADEYCGNFLYVKD